jgi:hypothetical protein
MAASIVVVVFVAETAQAKPFVAADLAKFLPAKLCGVARAGAVQATDYPSGLRHAAAGYIDMATRRAFNINIQTVQNKPASFTRFGRDGEVSRTAVAEHRGLHIKGFPAESVTSLRTADKSEAVILLREKIEIDVTVEPAADADQARRCAEELDLAGLDKLAD